MHTRVTPTLVLLVLALSSAGCIGNMDELKEAVGAKKPTPEPVAQPPLARAQANATQVVVGEPVRFSAEESKDPLGLPLTHAWDFGDGQTGEGPTLTHAFQKAGEFTVRLSVTNAKGLSDATSLVVKVGAAGRAPTATWRLLDAAGLAVQGGHAGQKLTFDATASSDPDGGALTYEWDFQDGATSHEAKVTRAYEKPGLFTVRLKVVDESGLARESSRLVAINLNLTFKGTLELSSGASASHAFPVAEGAQTLKLVLTFPGGFGGNDLVLVLKDAKGEEVARTDGETPPASQDQQARALDLTRDELARWAVGAWSAEVQRTKGVSVEYALSVAEGY